MIVTARVEVAFRLVTDLKEMLANVAWYNWAHAFFPTMISFVAALGVVMIVIRMVIVYPMGWIFAYSGMVARDLGGNP